MSAKKAILVGALLVVLHGTEAAAQEFSETYSRFNKFCIASFGAEKENLAYRMFGKELRFFDAGQWEHTSERSACIGFETNLPAKAYVEYGETEAYGSRTSPHERHFYLHLHYLKGLKPDTTYHYRLVAVDERGNKLASRDMTFATATPENVVYLPGDLEGPPYILDKAGTYYLLTRDLVADATGFEIKAEGVTLDLGGHTLVYNNVKQTDPKERGNFWDFIYKGTVGVRVATRRLKGFRILNGVVKQGAGNNSARGGPGYSPLLIYSGSGEVAGVTAEYTGEQGHGIRTKWPGACEIHHNVVIDHGIKISNRHSGVNGIGSARSLHHNLIKRCRQRGMGAADGGKIYANEIYVDSCATNSFAISCYKTKGAELYGNRIFGGGYLVVGIATVSAGVKDIMVHDNFIHLQATEPDTRWTEYGPQSGAYCCRITWGGVNLQYYDNIMVTRGRDRGMVRGVWACPNPSIVGCVFRNNIIKAIAQNEATTLRGAIVICGASTRKCAPIVFRDNLVISNFCNVLLGEPYGVGCNAEFRGNTFVKSGPDRGDYRTINVGYRGRICTGHKFIDSTFRDGAGYDAVKFDGTGERDISVGWTVTVKTTPGATVKITDKTGKETFSGKAAADGTAGAVLMEYLHTPQGKLALTPHTVSVEADGRKGSATVTADAVKTVEVALK